MALDLSYRENNLIWFARYDILHIGKGRCVLIEQIAAVPQLLDGIIVAVPLAQEPAIGSGFVSADGPEGRVVANSLVEVHVFDTTWIEIYSDDETLLGALAAKFNNFGQEQEPPAQEGGGYLGRAERIGKAH